MKQQNLQTGDYLRQQIQNNDLRRSIQLSQDKEAPERLIRHDDVVKANAKEFEENQTKKLMNQYNMNISYNNLQNKKNEEVYNRFNDISVERESAYHSNKDAYDHSISRLQDKAKYSDYVKHDLTDTHTLKYHEKVKYSRGRENKAQTLQLQTDIKQLAEKERQENLKNKQELASRLNKQIKDKANKKSFIKQSDIALGKGSTGFNFEFYPRQEYMTRQARDTGDYVRKQIYTSQRRNRDQRNEERKPPERLWTTQKIQDVNQTEIANDYNTKLSKANDFKKIYNQHMERKKNLLKLEKEIDHKTVNDYTKSCEKQVQK